MERRLGIYELLYKTAVGSAAPEEYCKYRSVDFDALNYIVLENNSLKNIGFTNV